MVPLAIPDELRVGEDVYVAHCPERVLPGRILLEVVQNDRIVGGVTPACAARAKIFYESFVNGQVFDTSSLVAEVTKLTTGATAAVAEEQGAKAADPATAPPPTEAKTYPLPDAEPGTEPPGT